MEEFRRERNNEWVGKTKSAGVVFHVKGGRERDRGVGIILRNIQREDFMENKKRKSRGDHELGFILLESRNVFWQQLNKSKEH